MRHVTPSTFKEIISIDRNNPTVDFINVCTPAEYKEKHIPGVRSVPLDELEKRSAELSGKKTIYVHCRSGRRGMQAIEKLRSLGIQADLVNVEGGIIAWEEAGFDTASLTSRLPIIRQVLIAAGTLTLVGVIFSVLLAHAWIYLSGVVGAGLLFAGVTGWCGMATVLARMPWNK